MATKLGNAKLVREIEVALGAIWATRRWPAERSTYRVEITAAGLRIRHGRGQWHVAPWDEVLGNAHAEEP